MWRIITGIGRGLRSVRPSQCCPQDCSDEAPNYHLYNDEVSKVHAATHQHHTTASSWSPLMVTRYDKLLQQVAFGVTQPKAIHTRSHDSGSPWVTESNNRYYHQTCPPWHWHALQGNKVLWKCCAEEEEKRKEEQAKEDWGNTWHYQEWKEVLQASPTLHTIGLGSAAALTLCLYRGWSEHSLCPYHAKGKRHQTHNGANQQHNLKSKYAAEEEEKNEELFWSNCRTFKHFCNSLEVSSEAPDKNYNDVTCEVPSTVIYKPDKDPPNDAEGLTVPVYSLKKKSPDLLTSFISNVQRNLENKNKIEDIYEDEGPFDDESELPFPPQRDKPDVNVRTDSGCMSDLQDLQSQTTTDLGTKDQYSVSGESDTNRTSSLLGSARNVSAESELQADAKDVKSEHSEVSRAQKEPDNSYADDTKMKDLHNRLFEVVKAHREDQLQEIFKKDGKTLSDTKPEEAVVYFQAGVMVGDPSSTFDLALSYHMGYGIMQDFEKARKLYEAAAAAGHGWAIYNLAVMMTQGLGGPYDPQRVHSLLQQAAKLGVTEATEALSTLEMEKQEKSIACEEPQLRKCYSEPSLRSSLTNQLSYSYSTDDLESLLDEDVWTDSDLSTGVICQQN